MPRKILRNLGGDHTSSTRCFSALIDIIVLFSWWWQSNSQRGRIKTFGIIVNVGNLSSTRTKIERFRKRSQNRFTCLPLHEEGATFKCCGIVGPKTGQRLFQRNKCVYFPTVTSVPRMTQSHGRRVLTDSMGKTLLQIKQKTPDDQMLEFQ
ncbi:hypothetical protein GWK47_014023 [Chionoecetes opilio]|uniref:Uncharacterized protein n=1 Tax=Chionoecetes opilio TaxID=41210 RepID=A0A8J5CNM1_CHIOP|nr:hypothetical protein GWK47_014023 [Chionoecetes opilio]